MNPRIAGLIVISLACTPLLNAKDFEPTVAIINARVTPEPGKTWEHGVIVIEKGRIIAAGDNLTPPAGAMILDAAGTYVYPGFIDCNSHVGMSIPEPDDAERSAVEGKHFDARLGPPSASFDAFRRLIHPHWRTEEVIDASGELSRRRADFRGLGFTAALISPKVVIFSGQSALLQLGDEPVRSSLLKSDVAQHAAFVTRVSTPEPPNSDRGEGGYPVTTMGAMAAFRQMMLDAARQRDLNAWWGRNPTQERPPVDHDLESLWPVMDGKIPVAFWANTENEIRRALDMAAEFKLRPMIVGGREAWKVADRLKKENVPIILSLKWSAEPKMPEGKKETDTQGKDAYSPLFDDAWQKQKFEPQRQFDERKRLWEEEADNARRLHEAGIRFAIGSFEMKNSSDLLKNLRKAIERGLPEEVAFAALTVNPAELLGVQNQLGTIKPGMLANLTILDKPLKDEKSRPRWVFIDGKRFDIGEKSDFEKKKEALFHPNNDSTTKPAEEAVAATTKTAESKPSSQPTSQPAPEFAVEIEADRKPTLQTGGSVLIRGANLLPVTSAEQDNTDLLIEKGVITKIGKNIAAPAGVKVLDLPGYFVIPGIIDCHSHMCSDGGLNEASVSVACEVRVRDVVDHTDVGAYRALAGGVTMIHTMHGSANTIGGQNVVLRLKYGKPASEMIFQPANRTVKFALGENVKQSNWGNRGTRFPNTRMGVEGTMRRSFDAALEYKAEWEKYEQDKKAGKDPRPPRKDLRLEALMNIHDGLIWVHCHCYRADEVLRLLAVAEDYGFRISVLQHILEGYRIIPEIVRHGCAASTFSDWWAYKIEAYEAIPFNAARMEQGGIIATVNSDSAEVVRHLNLEAAKCMRFGGLSANDALRLCTLNGAISLGVQDKVGSLEVGKLGDIAIFNGHPLDTFSKCVMTLIDGEVYFQHHDLDASNPPKSLASKAFVPTREPIKMPRNLDEYWILHGTAHPMNGPDIADSLVVISHGEVFRVIPASEQPNSTQAVVIDATGLHVYPGLINAGTNMGLYEIGQVAATVDQNEIADFQPDLKSMSAYNPFASAIDVTRGEGVTSTLVMPGGGFISPRAGWAQLSGWSMPEVSRGNDEGFIVNLPSLPAEFPPDMPPDKVDEQKKDYAKNMAMIEEFFRKARHYADTHKRNPQAPEATSQGGKPQVDQRFDAMIPCMTGEKPVFFAADGYKEIKEALVFADRYKLRPIIYGGQEAWKLADELAAKKMDVILRGTMKYPGDKFEPWDCVYHAPAILHEKGVRFCFGTGDATLAKQLGVEAGMAVAHGLPLDAALHAVTIDAAKILGVDDRWGSLTPGMIGDVIITTDNPLQASNTVVAEFIKGQPVELTSKHTRNDDLFRNRPKPNLGPEPKLRGRPAIRN